MDSNIEKYRQLVHNTTINFNPSKTLKRINTWLDSYIETSNTKKVVLGISGGKDSTVVAKILADKLGKENVIGLLMPNGVQQDIDDSIRVVKLLGIENHTINIKDPYNAMLGALAVDGPVSEEAKINIAPRLRMTTLYAFGQTHGCRVAGTGNLSEITLGYFTKFGDGAHDFNIIANLTSLEVMRLGEELGLPLDLVYKTPNDGLSGISDEEKLGISYIDVHKYLRDKNSISDEVLCKIQDKVVKSRHKRIEEPTVNFNSTNDMNLPEQGRLVQIVIDNGENT